MNASTQVHETGPSADAGAQRARLDTRLSAALVALRVAAGAVFVAHGGQKLFVYGVEGVTASFDGMGIPLAGVAAPAVALIEALGGLALIFGLFTRWTAVALAGVMLGALLVVHLPNGFFLPGGIEFVLVLLAVAVTLALAGGGEYSLDAVLGRRGAAR